MLTQTEFSVRWKIPFFTLRNWLKQAEPPIRGSNRAKLAAALDMKREELDRLLDGDDRPVAPMVTTASPELPEGSYIVKARVAANDASFLAPLYPSTEELESWASDVLHREVRKLRTSRATRRSA